MADIEAPDGWAVVDGKLHRDYQFADFDEAWAFMGQVARVARERDHHPDWSNSWNKVTIDLVTHSQGGITDGDVAFAEAVNALP